MSSGGTVNTGLAVIPKSQLSACVSARARPGRTVRDLCPPLLQTRNDPEPAGWSHGTGTLQHSDSQQLPSGGGGSGLLRRGAPATLHSLQSSQRGGTLSRSRRPARSQTLTCTSLGPQGPQWARHPPKDERDKVRRG